MPNTPNPNRGEFEELTDTPRRVESVPKGLRVPKVASKGELIQSTQPSQTPRRERKLGPTDDSEQGFYEVEPEVGTELEIDPEVDPANISGYNLPTNVAMCPTPYCRTLIRKPAGVSETVECHVCRNTFEWSQLAASSKAPKFSLSRRIKTGMLVEITLDDFSLVFALAPDAPQTIEAFKNSASSFNRFEAFPAYVKALGGSSSAKPPIEKTSLVSANGTFKAGTLLWRDNFFGILKRDVRIANAATALGTLIGGTKIIRDERRPEDPPVVSDISVDKAADLLGRIETGNNIASIKFEGVESVTDKRFESRRPSYEMKKVSSSPAVAPKAIRDAVSKYAGPQAASEVEDAAGLENLETEKISYEFTHRIGDVLRFDPRKHKLSKTLNLTATANRNDPVVVARHGILINPPGPCAQCLGRGIHKGKECERCKISSSELLAMPTVVKMSDLSRDVFTDDNVELWKRIDLSKLVKTFPKAASLLIDTPAGANLELDLKVNENPYITRYDYLAYDKQNKRWFLLESDFGFKRHTLDGKPLAIMPIYNVVEHPELLGTLPLLPIVAQPGEERYKVGDAATVPTNDDFMTADELNALKDETVIPSIYQETVRSFTRGGKPITVAYTPATATKPLVRATNWSDIQKLVSTNAWYK